jgi:cytoskeletal protein RodZ
MTDEHSAFGARLRVAREARGVSLRHIADVTKLPLRMLEALERGKVSRLPGGIYRRSIVRSYAREIGLDPEATLRDFLKQWPDDLPPPKGSEPEAPEPPEPARGPSRLARLGGGRLPWSLPR